MVLGDTLLSLSQLLHVVIPCLFAPLRNRLGTWGTCFGGRGKVKIHENVMRTTKKIQHHPTAPFFDVQSVNTINRLNKKI